MLIAEPDLQDARYHARRADFVSFFVELLDLAEGSSARGRVRQHLFDCYSDGWDGAFNRAVAFWCERPELAEAERCRAEATRDLLIWFDAGATVPSRGSLRH